MMTFATRFSARPFLGSKVIFAMLRLPHEIAMHLVDRWINRNRHTGMVNHDAQESSGLGGPGCLSAMRGKTAVAMAAKLAQETPPALPAIALARLAMNFGPTDSRVRDA